MAKTVADKQSFRFVKGLNTEAGELTFPPDTWQEGDNIVPQIDGSIRRRLAMNYETGYALSTQTDNALVETTMAYVNEEWNSVGGNGSINFSVVQRGPALYFYLNTGAAVSAQQKSFTLDISAYTALGNPNVPGAAPVHCSSCNGKLLVVSADTDPILVVYDEPTDTISHSAVTLNIRDLSGVPDEIAVDTRPLTLEGPHYYNLLNQGWTLTLIGTYWAATGYYPSSAQSWTSGKNATDDFEAGLLDKQDFGTSPSPKGRFVLPAFSKNRTIASGINPYPGYPPELEPYRPSTSAFYAGRAWYAGMRSKTMGSWVMFSQVAETSDKYGNCYQDADPTSEIVSDLVDSDGGVIPIQDAGTIVNLLASHDSMLVFADNGVWQIAGSADAGFSASNYTVKKICEVGCVAHRSVVEAEGTVFFWSSDGIWTVGLNQVGGWVATNITSTTIQSFYIDSIPVIGKAFVSGRYFLSDRTIYWAFNGDSSQDGVTRRFKKTRLLCIDLRLGAPYTMTVQSLASSSPYFVDIGITKNKTATSETIAVVDDTGTAVVVGADAVVVVMSLPVLKNSQLRFLTLVPVSGGVFKTTFSRFEDGTVQAQRFRDWYSKDGVGAAVVPYFITGWDIAQGQGGDKSMQGLYCVAFHKRTETGVDGSGNPINDSSCLMQVRWDWTDSSVANKWSREQETYRHKRLFLPAVPSSTFTDGYPVVVSKSKIRGRGKALHIRWLGVADKDMQMLGWAIIFVGNQNV